MDMIPPLSQGRRARCRPILPITSGSAPLFTDLLYPVRWGAARDASLFQTIVMGLVNVIFTIIAIITVDKFGRKPLLIIGSLGMTVGMFGVAGLAFFEQIGIATLVFIIIYTASFMMSWGPVVWVLLSEIFPNKIRGQALAIAVAAQWAANYFISSSYPMMMEVSGGMTYTFYGVMSILSAVFVWKLIPETKGKSLEELETLLKKSSSVREVVKRAQ